MKIRFNTWQQYKEAWEYMTSIGAGFTYNNAAPDLWIDPTSGEDLGDEAVTIQRLKQIAE